MLPDPTEGLYEALLTDQLREAIEASASRFDSGARELDPALAPLHLARYIHDRTLQALKGVGKKDQLNRQVALVNAILKVLSEQDDPVVDDRDRIVSPGRVLEWLTAKTKPGLGAQASAPPTRPQIPLSTSELLVNGRHDLNVASEVKRELSSADRVDLLISFLKFSGVRIIQNELADFLARRPGGLRVLTTVYTGATEPRALETLRELGAQIRVSYDTQRTRLHAKAWLFHRNSRFSTAIVGSSNLSGAAILDGLEWNVRLSNVDNVGILNKFQATFDQYWDDPEFRDYDGDEFEEIRQEIRRRRVAPLLTKIEVRPRPHQEEILEALDAERERGHWRNLVVAATGTGKTIVAALDYRRLRKDHGFDSLLFVAHRDRILNQSLSTFQVVLQNGGFGERLGSGEVPRAGTHVFASIQSLHEDRLKQLSPDAFDVVIVDEFHHAAANTYTRLLEHLKPKVLLGLTATPERTDGVSVLGWFEGRIAAEIRLWTAIDQGLLCPFQYFGVNDQTDLSTVNWRSGRYDVKELTNVYTATKLWVTRVLQEVRAKVTDPSVMKALGFCVSVKHAEYMAEEFNAAGLPALAVSSKTSKQDRRAAVDALERGNVNVLFTVDLFNEGVDIPSVDTLLFVRPTESATIFLQQLGRGLRLSEGKSCLTVLDFVGGAHRKFRFDRKFRALLGGTRRSVERAVKQGFPHLPAGCALRLDRHVEKAVLENIRRSLKLGYKALVEDLRGLGRDVTLAEFVEETGVELEEVYASRGRCWTHLRREATLPTLPEGPAETKFAKGLARVTHVDDPLRLSAWQKWLAADRRPTAATVATQDYRLQLMLMMALGFQKRPVAELDAFLEELWCHPALRSELSELLQLLEDRVRRRTHPLDIPGVPLRVHATYSRDEIMAAFGITTPKGKVRGLMQGVCYDKRTRTDMFLITLEKSEKDYSPTTLYNDYPISPTQFHWESQGATREKSTKGQRYIHHASRGTNVLLFVRASKKDDRRETRPYMFLGSADYQSHQAECPIQFVWRLHRPMPTRFFEETKVAAG
jgi:superfamily II DNA or RNA helicase